MSDELLRSWRAAASNSGRRWSQWRQWAGRGTLATVDQGFVSGSNFIVNLVLARWLTARDYGIYGLVLAVTYLVIAIHQALFLEPMSILGASNYAHCQKAYLKRLLWLNLLFSLLVAAGLAALSLCVRFMHSDGLSSAFLVLAVSYPVTLLFAFVRAGCYLRLSPGASAAGSLGYGLFFIAAAWTLNLFHWISISSVLITIAAGAAIGVVIVWLGYNSGAEPDSESPGIRDISREHWRYGRWALAATPVMWVPENICYAFTTFVLGIPAVAVVRAMMNLVVPLLQLANSSTRLLNPYLANKVGRQGHSSARRSVRNITILFATLGIAYAIGLRLFHEPIFRILYGNRFGGSSDLLGWMGLVTTSYLLLYAPLIGLRVIQAPFLVFVSYCGAALMAVVTGLPLTMSYGVRGAFVSLFVTNVAASLFAARLFWKRTREEAQSPAAPGQDGSGLAFPETSAQSVAAVD